MYKNLIVILKILTLCLIMLAGCAEAPALAESSRPTTWAAANAQIPGLPNLYRVNENLYRSAQPLPSGFEYLNVQQSLWPNDRPIKTIISLRSFTNDTKLLPSNSNLRLEQIRFYTWHPEDEDVVAFLRMVNSPALQPVLVHCQHGSDRTGTMIAIYRIALQGWSKQQAIDEMVQGGYGYHPVWKNLQNYINALDVDAIKQKAAAQGTWP